MAPFLRFRTLRALAAGLILGCGLVPASASASRDFDFVFRDEDGHLVLRFVGAPASGLTRAQREEVLNQEFSIMVHDRLRADLYFEMEPRDAVWAEAVEPRLEHHLEHAAEALRDPAHGFATPAVECRSTQCRVIIEHGTRWSLAEHEPRMNDVQGVISEFIAANAGEFDSGFVVTAYEQMHYTPHIKVFLRRAAVSE